MIYVCVYTLTNNIILTDATQRNLGLKSRVSVEERLLHNGEGQAQVGSVDLNNNIRKQFQHKFSHVNIRKTIPMHISNVVVSSVSNNCSLGCVNVSANVQRCGCTERDSMGGGMHYTCTVQIHRETQFGVCKP